MKFIIFSIFLMACSEIPVKEGKGFDPFMKQNIKFAILKGVEDNGKHYSPSALILVLGTIESKESRDLLIELIDVYIGSARSEALTYAIGSQGHVMVELLEKAKNKHCAALRGTDFKLNCIERAQRDELIDDMIKQILSDEKFQYAY